MRSPGSGSSPRARHLALARAGSFHILSIDNHAVSQYAPCMTKEESIDLRLSVLRREKHLRSLTEAKLALMMGKTVAVACVDQRSADPYRRDIFRMMGGYPEGLTIFVPGEEMAGVALSQPPIFDDLTEPTPEQQEHCLNLWRQLRGVLRRQEREDLATFGEKGYWRKGPSFQEFLAGGSLIDPED